MSMIKVTSEELRATSADLQRGSEDVAQQLRSLEGKVRSLVDAEWSGAASGVAHLGGALVPLGPQVAEGPLSSVPSSRKASYPSNAWEKPSKTRIADRAANLESATAHSACAATKQFGTPPQPPRLNGALSVMRNSKLGALTDGPPAAAIPA